MAIVFFSSKPPKSMTYKCQGGSRICFPNWPLFYSIATQSYIFPQFRCVKIYFHFCTHLYPAFHVAEYSFSSCLVQNNGFSVHTKSCYWLYTFPVRYSFFVLMQRTAINNQSINQSIVLLTSAPPYFFLLYQYFMKLKWSISHANEIRSG